MQGGIRDWWELSLVKKVEIYIIYLEALPNTQRTWAISFLLPFKLQVTEFQRVFFFFSFIIIILYIYIIVLKIVGLQCYVNFGCIAR